MTAIITSDGKIGVEIYLMLLQRNREYDIS